MGESRKFNIAEGLSSKFGSASARWGGLSAVVEAANNFLGGYDVKTEADVQRLLYDAATNPGSLGASVMVTSHTPNDTPETQKKKEDEARDALFEMLQEQIRQSNERISKMIDKCMEMAEWCRKQAEKAAEAMDKIATRMAKNSQFINNVDELFENYKTTGHFDKEKARRMLLERGVKTDEKIGEAKLLELLQKESMKAVKDNNDLSELHDEYEKQKQKFEESAKEIERLARELKQRRDEINKIEDPNERAPQLKELESQYNIDVQYRAKQLEIDQATKQALDLKFKEQYEQKTPSVNKDESSDLEAALAAIDTDTTQLRNQFVAAANSREKEINPNKNNLKEPAEFIQDKSNMNFSLKNSS